MKRMKAYLLMSIPYAIGGFLGYLIFCAVAPTMDNPLMVLLGLLLADLCATVIVWAFGVAFKNSSFYDAYWSLVPWLLILALMLRFSLFNSAVILFFISFSVWSFRLTINWAYTCKSIKTEDWRYTQYREQNKLFLWHIINFFGINLMPTLIVFMALTPAILLTLNNAAIDVFVVLGAIVILLGTLIETLADISMHKFRKLSQNEPTLKTHTGGLWKYCRHPNYLGEIIVWIGVYISALSTAPLLFFGAIGIILLFTLVSIPLAEKRHLSRRPDYAHYKTKTPMLLPIPKGK